MILRRSLFIFAALAVAVTARAKVFDMGTYGKVTFDLPAHWKATTDDMPSRGYRIYFNPTNGENITCHVLIYYYPNQDWFSDNSLMKYVGEACKQFAVGSVEKAVNLERFRLDHGFGYYASFTDATLTDRKPSSGNYQKITSGMICLNGHIIMTVSIYSDSTDTDSFKAVMQMLRTSHFDFPKNDDDRKLENSMRAADKAKG